MAEIIVKQSNNVPTYLVKGFVETVDEIQKLPTDYTPGSRYCVIEDGSIWVLTRGKEWKKLAMPAGGSGSGGGGTSGGTNCTGCSAHLMREIVDKVPEANFANDQTIYMLKIEGVTGPDKYQEWMRINGEMVMIGDTSVDLSQFARLDEENEWIALQTFSEPVIVKDESGDNTIIINGSGLSGTGESTIEDFTSVTAETIEGTTLKENNQNLEDKYLQKVDAEKDYLKKEDAEQTYIPKSDADNFAKLDGDNIFTGSNTFDEDITEKGEKLEEKYLKKSDAADTYVTNEAAENFAKLDGNNTFAGENSFTQDITEKGEKLEEKYLQQEDANNTYLTKTEAGDTYLTKEEAGDTYITKEAADGKYLTEPQADAKYAQLAGNNEFTGENSFTQDITEKGETLESKYLKKADATNFATKDEIPKDYLTQETADVRYAQLDGDNTFSGSNNFEQDIQEKGTNLEDKYLQKTDADNKYATKDEIPQDYLTEEVADGKYAKLNEDNEFTGSNSFTKDITEKGKTLEEKYLQKADAESIYAKKEDVVSKSEENIYTENQIYEGNITVEGDTTVNNFYATNITEGGTALEEKYAQLHAANTFTESNTFEKGLTSSETVAAPQFEEDGELLENKYLKKADADTTYAKKDEVVSTTTENIYEENQTYNKDVHIGGNTTIEGNTTVTNLEGDTITSNTFVEGGKNLEEKYAQLAAPNIFTEENIFNKDITEKGQKLEEKYLQIADADKKYLTKDEASTYVTEEQVTEQITNIVEGNYAKLDAENVYTANNNFTGGIQENSINLEEKYLQIDEASSIYLTQTDAENTYIKKTEAASLAGNNIYTGTNTFTKDVTIQGNTTVNKLTGTTVNATTLQEGGINLEKKYAQLNANNTFTGDTNTFSGSVVANSFTEGGVTLAEKYLTKAEALEQYYTKNDLYTKNEVDAKIAEAMNDFLTREIVTELPNPEEADPNTLYMIKEPPESNFYKEYLLIGDKLELIGTTEVGLSNYVKKEELTDGSITDLTISNDLTVEGDIIYKGEPLEDIYIKVDDVVGKYLPLTGGTLTGKLYFTGKDIMPTISMDNQTGEIDIQKLDSAISSVPCSIKLKLSQQGGTTTALNGVIEITSVSSALSSMPSAYITLGNNQLSITEYVSNGNPKILTANPSSISLSQGPITTLITNTPSNVLSFVNSSLKDKVRLNVDRLLMRPDSSTYSLLEVDAGYYHKINDQTYFIISGDIGHLPSGAVNVDSDLVTDWKTKDEDRTVTVGGGTGLYIQNTKTHHASLGPIYYEIEKLNEDISSTIGDIYVNCLKLVDEDLVTYGIRTAELSTNSGLRFITNKDKSSVVLDPFLAQAFDFIVQKPDKDTYSKLSVNPYNLYYWTDTTTYNTVINIGEKVLNGFGEFNDIPGGLYYQSGSDNLIKFHISDASEEYPYLKYEDETETFELHNGNLTYIIPSSRPEYMYSQTKINHSGFHYWTEDSMYRYNTDNSLSDFGNTIFSIGQPERLSIPDGNSISTLSGLYYSSGSDDEILFHISDVFTATIDSQPEFLYRDLGQEFKLQNQTLLYQIPYEETSGHYVLLNIAKEKSEIYTDELDIQNVTIHTYFKDSGFIVRNESGSIGGSINILTNIDGSTYPKDEFFENRRGIFAQKSALDTEEIYPFIIKGFKLYDGETPLDELYVKKGITGDYLPLTGGTMTGAIVMRSSDDESPVSITINDGAGTLTVTSVEITGNGNNTLDNFASISANNIESDSITAEDITARNNLTLEKGGTFTLSGEDSWHMNSFGIVGSIGVTTITNISEYSGSNMTLTDILTTGDIDISGTIDGQSEASITNFVNITANHITANNGFVLNSGAFLISGEDNFTINSLGITGTSNQAITGFNSVSAETGELDYLNISSTIDGKNTTAIQNITSISAETLTLSEMISLDGNNHVLSLSPEAIVGDEGNFITAFTFYGDINGTQLGTKHEGVVEDTEEDIPYTYSISKMKSIEAQTISATDMTANSFTTRGNAIEMSNQVFTVSIDGEEGTNYSQAHIKMTASSLEGGSETNISGFKNISAKSFTTNVTSNDNNKISIEAGAIKGGNLCMIIGFKTVNATDGEFDSLYSDTIGNTAKDDIKLTSKLDLTESEVGSSADYTTEKTWLEEKKYLVDAILDLQQRLSQLEKNK